MGRKHFPRNEWRQRVNPAFVRYWAATKKDHLMARTHNSQEPERAQNLQEIAAASRELPRREKAAQVGRAIMAGLDAEKGFVDLEPGLGYITNPESSAFFRELVFLKYGITFRELMVKLEHNRTAYRKLIKVHEDYYRVLTGKVKLEDLKLKFKGIHFQLMLQGLDLGLSSLNEWELAACFDEICPCAQRHSVEYLKKLRTRIKKACEHVLESASKPTSIDFE